MRISPMCKALALHEIFDEFGVRPGGALPLAEIEQAWRDTGLRHSDLAETLEEVRMRSEFDVHDHPQGPQIVLTEHGYDLAQRDPEDLAEIDELIRAYATLALLRRRQPDGHAHGRRRIDHLS